MDKEAKIKETAKRYYLQKPIQKAMLEMAKQREIVPRYYEGFGKRPDILVYEGDIKSLVAKGATSFHCSEERWKDPLQLRTSMSKQDLDELRAGWDFIIDIDCKFIEYSKVTAALLVESLAFHNVQAFGVKFSGGTGFHLAIAQEAFPKEIYGKELRLLFPSAAKAILEYLKQMIHKELGNRIRDLDSIREISEKTGMKEEELTSEKEFDPYSVITLDTGLISSRHLFRMPFSLNEKTSLASVVIRPGLIDKFNPKLAKPLEITRFRTFIQTPEKDEGKELLIQALDLHKKVERVSGERQIIEIKGNVTDDLFPPCINNALAGIKKDGRKRGLFILINFFRSINMPKEEIKKRLEEWNKKNYAPLSESYLQGQINWHTNQQKKFPPPNCDHPFYKEIGIYTPECKMMKNPLSYVARRMRMKRAKKERITNRAQK